MFYKQFARLLLAAVLTDGATADDVPTKSDGIVLSGQVVNQAHEPVGGATLVLVLRHGLGTDSWQVQTNSDKQGRFRLAVPEQWIAPGAFYRSRTIWCYAAGYALATGSAYKQIDEGDNNPISIQLEPTTGMEFKVIDPYGEPHQQCRVEPHHWLAGSYDIPPQTIRDLAAAQTDQNGVARLSAMQPSPLRRVAVVSPTYGTQRMQLDEQGVSTTAIIRLRDVGAIEGRLICNDARAIVGVRVAVENIIASSEAGLTEGVGQTETTADGRFRIDRVAAGPFDVFLTADKVPAYRPRLPERVIVKAQETTELDIPLEASVLVRGSVVARGSDRPVADAFVSVSYGDRYQHEHVVTDASGKFEAHVLPGAVRQHLIAIPKPFRTWINASAAIEQFEVAADKMAFDLPPLEIVESRVVAGSVVDEKRKPVTDCLVTAQAGPRSLGYGRTDDTGSFQLNVARDAKIEGYQVSPRSMTWQPVKVVSQSPLVLQIADPKQLANVEVTTMPTPEDKQQPEFETVDPSARSLIVAKSVLIFDGRMATWPEVADALKKGSNDNSGNDSQIVHYYLTHGAFDDDGRKTELRNWAALLSTATKARVQQRGLILNQPAERYDALEPGDRWPPGAEKPIVGRAISLAGEPIVGAQAVLLPPPMPTSRLRFGQIVYLTNGQIRQPMDYIIVPTHENGQFRFDFPAAGANVMILAPEGFALVAATDQLREIELAPWARVTATLPQDKKSRIQTLSISISARPTNGGPTTHVSMSAGSTEKAENNFEFVAVPPMQKATVQRIVWEEREGTKIGNSRGQPLPLDLEPGITTHLEFGPLEE